MERRYRFGLWIPFLVLLAVQVSGEDLRSDFDGNGSVDFKDFVLFARAFGTRESPYDLREDGTVDFNDFVLFAADFGRRASDSQGRALRWAEIDPPNDVPSARSNPALLYEPSGERALLFAGKILLARDDLWSFDVLGETWRALTVEGTGPEARWSHDAEIDVANRRICVFGGTNGSVRFSDLWELAF